MAKLTQAAIERLEPREQPFEARDDEQPGLLLRVQPSGVRTWYVVYHRANGARTRAKVGKYPATKPPVARRKARAILTGADAGKDHNAEKAKTRRELRVATWAAYVENEYKPWVLAHRKDGEATMRRLKACFEAEFGAKALKDITSWVVEKWRAARLKKGVAPATLNRDVTALKAALAKAVEWGMLDAHPLSRMVKPLKVDTKGVVRYLEADEEKRLRDALAAAEGNSLSRAHDLRPMVLVSLHTGLRFGELCALTWGDIDLKRDILTVRGSEAKSGTTRHIPLNSEAKSELERWRERCEAKGGDVEKTDFVFPGRNGQRTEAKTAWAALLKAAKVKNFRWHDMRHHFASKLVMAGVDLNTVRELLGHADIKMTLRYSHLAPEHKAAAVAKLIVVGA